MKRLILSLGILITATLSFQVKAQAPCVNDLTAPTVTWNGSEIGKTAANPLIIKLNTQGYAAIVADSGNGQAGVNKAKVFVPAQFTSPAGSSFTVVDAQDDCADTYTGTLATKWPKFTISKGAFVCNDVNATKVNPMAVTYNVFDASNNVSTGTVYIKVIEAVKPTITTKPATLTLSAAGTATLVEADVVLSKFDNCGAPTVTLSQTSFTCDDLGLNTVYVKVTDASGNKDSATAAVTILDETAPSVTFNAATLVLDANGDATLVAADVTSGISDACDNAPVVTFSQSAFDCSNVGTNNVIVTVTDASGNSTSQTVVVTVEDNDGPTITLVNGGTLTVYLNNAGNATIAVSNVVTSSIDNCSVQSTTLDITSFTCADLGLNEVEVKSIDVNGNESLATMDVTVEDTIAPSLSVQDVTLYLDANGDATLTQAAAVVSSSDACDTPVITFSDDSFVCADAGSTISVAVTATDASSNSRTLFVDVTVQDTISPSLTLLAGPLSFSLGTDGTKDLVEADIVDGTGDNCGVASVTLVPDAFDCNDKGANLVTVTVTDDNGNTTVKTVSIAIVDDLDPILVTQDATISVDANGSATVTAADVVVSATDNCDVPTIDIDPSTFTCSDAGTVQVDVTATDAEGNSTTNTVTVTIEDTFAPTLVKNVYERNLRNGFALLSVADVLNEIAQDNCAIDFTTSALSREYFDCEDVGVNTVTASIFDMAGNFAYVNFSVIIHDTIMPVANTVASYTIQLDANGSASVTAEDVDNGSSDNCDNFELSLSQTSFDCDDLGSNTVTFTIEDEEGNTATSSVNVIVSDTIRPVWRAAYVPSTYTSPAQINAFYYNDGFSGIYDLADACLFENQSSWNSNDGKSLLINTVMTPGPVAFQLGTGTTNGLEDFNVEVWAGWGASGNIAPNSTSCGGFMIPGANPGFTSAPPALYGAPGSAVSTSSAAYSDSALIGSISGALLKSRSLAGALWLDTVYNSYGADIKIKFVPAGVQYTSTVYLDQNGSASIDPESLFGSYASDNCDLTVSSNKTMFTCVDASASPVTITLTATDDAGNTRNRTAVITVLDTLSPVIDIASAYDIYLDANGQATLEFADIDNGTADNCTQFSDLSVVLSKTAFDCGTIVPPVAPGGQPYTVDVTVTDLEGNDRTVSLVVTVRDTLAPVASVNTVSYTAVLDNNGAFTLGVADITPSLVSFTDNCEVDNVSFAAGSTLNYDCDDAGNTITVTLVAVDEAGNETEVVVNVTVEDQDAPVWNVASGPSTYTSPAQINAFYFNDGFTGLYDLDNACLFENQSSWNANDGKAELINTVYTAGPVAFQLATGTTNGLEDFNVEVWAGFGNTEFTSNYTTCGFGMMPPVAANPGFTGAASALYGAPGSSLSFSSASYGDSALIGTISGALLKSRSMAGALWLDTVYNAYGPDIKIKFVPVLMSTVTLNANGEATLVPQSAFASYVTDNCDYTITSSITSFDCEDAVNSPIEVTLTATDPSGNASTQIAYITVEDNIDPTANVVATYTATLDANGSITVDFSDIDNGSFDNCEFKVVPSSWTYDCDDISSALLSGSLIDSSGNSTPFSVNVTVEDKSAPVFDGAFVPAEITVYAVQYDCFGLVNVDVSPLPNVTDNCDNDVDVVRHWSGQLAAGIIPMPVGMHTLWAVATDDYGNTDSTAYAYVEVIDTTLPDATFWNNVTVVLGANGTANITPATIIDASYDNCGIANVSITPDVVDCDDLGGGILPTGLGGTGYVTLTVTLTDFNGNTRTYFPMVAVEDQSAPVFTPLAGAASVALGANGTASIVVGDLVSTVTDNCEVQSVTLSQSSFDCTDLGVNTIVLTASDASGNVSTYTVALNVVDNVVPTYATKNIGVSLNASGNATIVATDVIDGPVTDNCSNVFTYALSKTFFDCTNVGINTVSVSVADGAGNVTTKNVTVTVVDNLNPTLTLANGTVTVALNGNGQATLGVSEVVALATDNCSVQSVVLSKTSFDCSNLGAGTVTVTATDVNGNVTTATQNIVVVDLIAPAVTVKSTPTAKQLDAAGSATIVFGDLMTSVVDNCTALPTIVWSPTTVSCAQVGPVTVTITATDASGNVTNTSKVIQVSDELAPALATKAYTAVLNANGNAIVVESDVVLSKSDNCGVPAVTLSKTDFDCTNKGANNVLVTATDVNGNATTLTAVVTVVDNIAPTYTTAPALTVYLNGSGTASISVPDVVTSSEDNCDVPTVTLSKYTFNCSNMPSTVITVTATDAAGNVTSGSYTVNVMDAIAPVITTKSTATTLALDATGSATVAFADILTSVVDNCTASPTVTWSPTTVTCAQVGPVTVSITTTDASGNVSVATKVIQVVDAIAPSLVTKAYTAVLNANGNATIVETNVVQSKSDNCGVPAVSLSKTIFDCTNKGANNVLVTATDVNGNATTLTAVVTVVDNIAPTYTTAPALTVYLNGSGTASISVPDVVTSSQDNCDVPTVTLSKYTFNCSNMPSTVITVTATDAAGNVTSGSYTVNVMDAIAPVITTKSTATTLALDATGSATVAFADILTSVVDNCTASPTVTWSPTSVSCAQVGPVTVSITTTDASGNVSVATKVIQVVDAIAPSLVTKAFTAFLNANGNATIVETNVVQSKSDNCGVPAVSLSKTIFDCTNKGANTVVVTATDVNGNVTTQNAVVTVVDNTAPTFVTAPSLTLQLNAQGVATISVPSVVTSAADNCDVPTVTLSKYTFTCADMPSTVITVTAVDASGNTTTGSYTVNVVDQLAPVITPKATPTTIALDATGNAAVTLADIMGTAVDNCTASPVVTWFPTSVSCAQVGPVTVTITAADASGNVSNTTKVIQVIDNIAPTIVLKGTSLVTYTLPLNASGNATLTVGNVVNSATDNCGTPVVSLSKTSFDCSNLGDNVVVVTAIDAFGNVKTSNAIVKVVDVTAPSIVTPSTQVVLNLSAAGTATLPLGQVMLSTSDNCGVPTVIHSPSSFTCANLGNNTVTITSTDASGNVSTATVVVLVQDVTAPVIATVSGTVTKVLGANGTVAISQSDVVASVTDACTSTPTVTWTPTSVSCSNLGNVAVVITSVDASGNVSTSVKTVLVVDQTAPVISAPAAITLNLNSAGTVTLPNGVASATDNCAVNGIQYSKTFFDCSNLGVNTVTITSTDVSGNVATTTMSVTVVDNTAPVLTLVGSPVTVPLNAAGSASINAAQLVANASDNCAVSTFTVTPNTFNCSNLGGNTVTVTATDASGNATSQTVTINVVDITGPSIVVNPAAVTVALNANGVGSITAAQVVSTVTDNCTTTPSLVVTPNVFTCSDLGQQMVTIFATDAAGNITTTTKLINVVDLLAPVIVSAPQNVTLPGCNATFTYAYQVTDNCSYNATMVAGLASGAQFPVGTTTVTWSFNDPSGNTTNHSFNVTVLPLGNYTLPAVNEYCAGHGHFDLTAGQTGLVFYGSSVYNNGTTFYTEVPGLYTLNFVFTDANGCTQNGTFNLIVRPRPAKPVINQVAATTLESSVTGATYQWYRNEQPITGAKNKQYVFNQGGKYEVVVFNAYGCGTMSEGFVISNGGLSVEEVITSVRLFPNPTSSAVTLETSFEAAEDFTVTLVDMVGSVVYRGTMTKGSNQHVVDMSGLAAGTYNVILTDASGASSNVQRVVKID